MHRSLLARAAAFEAALALLALAVGWLVGLSPTERLSLSGFALLVGLAATVPPVAGVLALERTSAAWARRIREAAQRLLAPMFRHARWYQLALLSAAAGIGEEFLFRGLIQQGLGDLWGPGAGLLAASLVFGLLHWLTPGYALLAGLGGAYLGWLYQVSGNLLVPIVVHAAYDMVALCLLAAEARRVGADESAPGENRGRAEPGDP